MGSPLTPILANLFIGFHGEKWINEYSGPVPMLYRRYFDDIFVVFNSENEAVLFFEYINSKHKNIKFTTEKQLNKKLPFLNIFKDNSSSNLKTRSRSGLETRESAFR